MEVSVVLDFGGLFAVKNNVFGVRKKFGGIQNEASRCIFYTLYCASYNINYELLKFDCLLSFLIWIQKKWNPENVLLTKLVNATIIRTTDYTEFEISRVQQNTLILKVHEFKLVVYWQEILFYKSIVGRHLNFLDALSLGRIFKWFPKRVRVHLLTLKVKMESLLGITWL